MFVVKIFDKHDFGSFKIAIAPLFVLHHKLIYGYIVFSFSLFIYCPSPTINASLNE